MNRQPGVREVRQRQADLPAGAAPLQATEEDDVKTVPARDLEQLQRAILALHSHRDLASFRRAVPGIFLELIPAAHFALADIRIDLRKKTGTVLNLWERPTLFTGEWLAAIERNLYDHPFAQHAPERGVVGTLRLSDFLTLPQLRRTRLYREVLKPLQSGRQLSSGSWAARAWRPWCSRGRSPPPISPSATGA